MTKMEIIKALATVEKVLDGFPPCEDWKVRIKELEEMLKNRTR